MTAKFVRLCLLLSFVVFSTAAFAQKEHIVRQQGANCGEDDKRIVTCGTGLECKDGTCQMRSFLSPQTNNCKAELQKIGLGPKEYVAVHDGFCYKDDKCSGLYYAVMDATPATEKLLAKASAGTEAFYAELDKLSADEKAKFKRAEDICKSCSPYCVIGPGFMGRGGY